jgi:hypothetical protein
MMPNQNMFSYMINNQPVYPKNILYLNIRASTQHRVRGVVFAVTKEQLISYDAREWIYDRYDMANALQGIAVTGGPVFAYVGKPQYETYPSSTPDESAVRASYLATIETGLEHLGADFRREYHDSSDPIPQHLIISDVT